MEGETLWDVYQSSRRLLLMTRDGLEKLEGYERSSSSRLDSPDISASLKKYIVHIQCLCLQMNRLWRSVAFKPQGDLWLRKMEQVSEETDSLKENLDKFLLRNRKRKQEAWERAQLLGRANGDSVYVLRIFDEEPQETTYSSSKMLEEAYSTGVAILSKYAEEGEWFKRAQRKALDILNTVRLSTAISKLIEKHNSIDRWIKYTWMVVTLIAVSAFWRWMHIEKYIES